MVEFMPKDLRFWNGRMGIDNDRSKSFRVLRFPNRKIFSWPRKAFDKFGPKMIFDISKSRGPRWASCFSDQEDLIFACNPIDGARFKTSSKFFCKLNGKFSPG